jgi:hypothetical protein
MQAAQVLLGILPTILTLFGTTMIDTSILALRRPLLAFILSAADPAVNPIRPTDYKSRVDLLQDRPGSMEYRAFKSRASKTAILVFQYIVAIAAAANVFHIAWQLSYLAVCGFAPDTPFLPLLWTVLSLPLHFAGTLMTYCRVRLVEKKDGAHLVPARLGRPSYQEWPAFVYRLMKDQVKHWQEFELSQYQRPAEMHFKDEGPIFLFLNWFFSTGAALLIILGTVVLSSTLFISTRDAVVLALRYIASAVACNMVVTYELSCIRHTIDVPKLRSRYLVSSGEDSDGEDSTIRKSSSLVSEFIPMIHPHMTI